VSSDPGHWQRVYRERQPREMSWYERAPEVSLELIERAAPAPNAAILDAGGGASSLAGLLIAAGYTDVTVADLSRAALERAREDLGEAAGEIQWVQADLRDHDFGRRFDLWHDRAVLHFMVEPSDREGYLATLRRSLRSGGHAILAAFGPQGPTRCSGLPVVRYSAAKLSLLLGGDFELLSSRLQDHRTPSGATQQFVYAHLLRK